MQVCSPLSRKDEQVLKRFTGMLPGLEGMRLDKLGLLSLACWRLRGDLIAVYKIMRDIHRIDIFSQGGNVKDAKASL